MSLCIETLYPSAHLYSTFRKPQDGDSFLYLHLLRCVCDRKSHTPMASKAYFKLAINNRKKIMKANLKSWD